MKRLMILLLSLVLLACVPTPEQEPIAQKESNARETVPFASLDLPKHVTADAGELGGAHLTVDADVIVPDNAVYGVSEVHEGRFDRETVTKLLQYFAADRPLYLRWEDDKAEIYQKLLDFEAIANEEIEMDMMMLQYLREAFESAPQEVEHIPFSLESVEPAEALCSLYALGSDGKSFLSYTDTQFLYSRDSTLDFTPESGIAPEDPLERQTPRILREDAEKAAKDLIEALHIENVALLEDRTEECAFFRLNRTVEWGYRFVFTPRIGNIACCYSDQWTVIEAVPPSVGAPWNCEWIELYVGQDGVMKFVWSFPAAYGEPDVRDAFLSFDKMQDLIQRQLLYMYSTEASQAESISNLNSDVMLDVKVDRIKLVRGTIQKKDDRSVGLNVPLWEVHYTVRYQDGTELSSSICFDASDGTYVEPRLSYKDLMVMTGRG
ncbi:MAG: hypothetical protein IKZ44_09360 [Clostridia bacterium]|nr:hypothetical protein [Clostridia bacterium]